MSGWENCSAPPWSPEAPDLASPLVFNRGGRDDLGRSILRVIEGAGRSLLIISPEVDDPRIEAALVAAQQRQVRVKVLTELRDNRQSAGSFETLGFESDRSAANLSRNHLAVRRLARERIACRALKYYAHAKLVIADDTVAILSSANLASNSLGWGAQPSLEAGLRIDEPRLVAALAEAFRVLWNAATLQLNLDRTDISVQNVTGPPARSSVALDRDVNAIALRWSFPAGGRGLRDRLRDLIAASRRRVLLCASRSTTPTGSPACTTRCSGPYGAASRSRRSSGPNISPPDVIPPEMRAHSRSSMPVCGSPGSTGSTPRESSSMRKPAA